MGRTRLGRIAAATVLGALALSGCGTVERPMASEPPAADSGPDPSVSESPTEADAIMTCGTIATEHAGIAQSLERLGGSGAAAALRERDAALARLAAQKGCAAF